MRKRYLKEFLSKEARDAALGVTLSYNSVAIWDDKIEYGYNRGNMTYHSVNGYYEEPSIPTSLDE